MVDKSKQLFDKLIEYSEADYYPFHMPGHKRNMKWDTNIYDMDITEIDGFDNLHHPEGIIKELEDRITTLYNTKKSFVMVNGSTGGLLSGIYSTVNYGDKILIARNCHKSVYNAVLLNGLNVRFVYPELDDNNICGPIGPDKVEEALKKDDSIKLVVITSPTYEGVVSDIEEIAKIVHKYKKILIVDEAHGSHMIFDDYFPKSALECDADIVIHSLHKTLPALTQSALFHINSDRVDADRVKNALSIFQTSSPSYIIMSGIDRCINILEQNKNLLFSRYIKMTEDLRNSVKTLKNIKLYESENYDKSKIVLYSDKIYGKKMYDILLNDYHLQAEMAYMSYTVLMTTICDKKYGYDRLLKALYKIDDMLECVKESVKNAIVPFIINNSSINISNACNKDKVLVKLENSVGRVCGEYIYLYPPGIPLIVPGENITLEIIESVFQFEASGLEICGLADKTNHLIKVVN